MESPPHFPSRNRSASALLLVLGLIVLVSVVVLAFFASATTERTAAHTQANSEAARNLSNNALQFAMAQISDGTKGGTAQAPLAWASQPGMIRTYDTSGKPAKFHKLYSASNMTTANFSLSDDLPPANWKSSPGVWVDLNAPVADSAGAQNYPILDPAAISGTTNVRPTGFAITSPPGYSGGNSTADNNQAPMPVRWLYQLRDGTLVAAGSSTGNTTTVSGATAANPIVGRIAFWADDETSKVNINTAAEGTYWDTPRFDSLTVNKNAAAAPLFPDFAYAAFQPALYEFQRYPGHPAQVALSSVFPNLTSQSATSLTPRLVWGGSQGGTVWAGNTTSTPQIALQNAPRKAPYATVDEYQFSGNYSASDNRTENVLPAASINKSDLEAAKFFITANSRTPEVNLFNLPRIACWPIDRSLSTNANSPRTTAFDRLIAFCSSTANGTTRLPYYFQRFDAQSPTNDYSNILRNQQLYAYLQRLTDASVPGFGGNFRSKYGDDRDQILTQIFDYIRCTNLSDPNLGGIPLPGPNWLKSVNQFANYQNMPVTGDVFCGQVMPIRIGNTMGFGRYYTLKDASMIFICTADGRDGVATGNATDTIYQQSNNISINATASYPGKNRTLFPGGNLTANGTTLSTTEKRFQIGLFLNYFLPSPAQLKCGPDMLVTVDGLQNIEIAGATNIDGGGTLFPAVDGNWPTPAGLVGRLIATFYSGYNPLYAYLPPRIPFRRHRSPIYVRDGGNGTDNVVGATTSNIIYPFVSRAFTLPAGMTMQLVNPVTLTIRLYQARGAYDTNDVALSADYRMPGAGNYTQIIGSHTNPNAQNLIQTVTLTFPAGTFPQPTLPVGLGFLGAGTLPAHYLWGMDGRIASPTTAGQQGSAVVASIGNTNLSNCFDTVRTVSVKTGDVRSVAATFDVPSTMFGVNSSAYNDINYKALHYFHDNMVPYGNPKVSDTSQAGKIIPGISNAFFTDYPKGTDSYCLYGDFDGPLTRVTGGTGPFINKPDEGDNLDIGSGVTSLIPYYGFEQSTVRNLNLYTPNRIMPSPGMFGSLPTKVKQQISTSSGNITGSWQTLLFRPQPTHPSFSTSIPDHLIMDLFWMPIVEPYALSENFSSAGKVNMNYQIVPFTYINRPTALMAAMKVEKIAARPLNTNAASGNTTFRLDLNTSESGGTLQQFKTKFDSGNIFRSATEICDIDLVPTRDPNGTLQTWSASWRNTFWAANANTGDNTRERPYTNLYARLTTKSNTFTVHVRAQALQKVPGTPADQWVEGRDKVVAEERISTVVERYLDADSGLPDFATDANALLSNYYRMRVLSNKRFSP